MLENILILIFLLPCFLIFVGFILLKDNKIEKNLITSQCFIFDNNKQLIKHLRELSKNAFILSYKIEKIGNKKLKLIVSYKI